MTHFVLFVLAAICIYAGLKSYIENGKEINIPTAIYTLLVLFFFLLITSADFNIFSVPVTEDNPVFQFKSFGSAFAIVVILMSIIVLTIIQVHSKIKETIGKRKIAQ